MLFYKIHQFFFPFNLWQNLKEKVENKHNVSRISFPNFSTFFQTDLHALSVLHTKSNEENIFILETREVCLTFPWYISQLAVSRDRKYNIAGSGRQDVV